MRKGLHGGCLGLLWKGHKHAIDGIETQVERVKHNLRKQAQEEVASIPSIIDALVDITAHSEENEALAGSLSTFSSLKSSLY